MAHIADSKWAPGSYNHGDASHALKQVLSFSSYKNFPQRGYDLIKEMVKQGVMIDLTHLNPDAMEEVLDFMGQRNIPPIVSHGKVFEVRNEKERALKNSTLCRIYYMGGMMGLALSGTNMTPLKHKVPYKYFPENYCKGTQDDFQLHANALNSILESCISDVFPEKKSWKDLSPNERMHFSFSYGSDWDGWARHGASKVELCGKDKILNQNQPTEFDKKGLFGPEALPDMFKSLEKQGMDLTPFGLGCEKLSSIWSSIESLSSLEKFIDDSKSNSSINYCEEN